MAKERKETYNVIEIGNVTIVSKKEGLKEMYEVADKILTKHKELVKKEKDMPNLMFG